jgi:hypothetical protein
MSTLPITVRPVKSVEIHVDHPGKDDLVLVYTTNTKPPYALAPDDWMYPWDVRFRFDSEFLPDDVKKLVEKVAMRQSVYSRRTQNSAQELHEWIEFYARRQLEGRLNLGKQLTLKLAFGSGGSEHWHDEAPISRIKPVSRREARKIIRRARRKLCEVN